MRALELPLSMLNSGARIPQNLMGLTHDVTRLSRRSRPALSEPRYSAKGVERIEFKNLGQFQKFDYVNSALAALQPRYERLIFSQSFCKLNLRQARRFALFNQERNERFMSFRAECLRHVFTHHKLRWALSLYLIFSYLKFRYFQSTLRRLTHSRGWMIARCGPMHYGIESNA